MWLSPHTRHTQRIIRRRNHLGVFACLLVAVLVTGILIGRASRDPEAPGQVFLDNAAPGIATPQARRVEPGTGQSRAPLGTVVRPTPTHRAQRVRPTSSVAKAPRDRNTIDGSLDSGDKSTTLGPETSAGTDGTSIMSPIEATVVKLTNRARAQAGCRPLRVDRRLVRSARAHSADMASSSYFSHSSPDGTSPWKRMERAGYRNGGAENIGRGYRDAGEAVRGWMGSPSHRSNIVNCDLRAIGVGVANGPGGPWWTQDFGYS